MTATTTQIDPLIALGEKIADIQHADKRRLILAQALDDERVKNAALTEEVATLKAELEALRPPPPAEPAPAKKKEAN